MTAVAQEKERKRRKAVMAAHEQRQASGKPAKWTDVVSKVKRERGIA
jgi:hypothetical protein